MDPLGSLSRPAPSRWSYVPSRICGEVSSGSWLESLDLFFYFPESASSCPCFTAIKDDGNDKRLVQFELACEADGVASPDPV